MLHLILSEDWTAGTGEVMSRIAADVQKKLGGRILIVPELISHETERLLCSYAGDTASRYAEVVTFSRLASRSDQITGFGAAECLDAGGRLVAMAAAARQLSSRLKSFAAIETRPEFLTELVDAIDEFKRCCITPEQLKRASEKTDGSLAQKLEELSLLMEAYDAVCSQGKRDPRDLLSAFLKQLESSNFTEEHCFYVDGFPDFTIQNLNILKHFIMHSPDVTICLNCDEQGSKKPAFEKAGITAQRLIEIADSNGIPVKIDYLRGRDDVLAPVRRKLFQGSLKQLPAPSPLSLFQADTVWNEVLWSAHAARKLVLGGARWRDITIVCTDPAKYHGLIKLIFDRMHIPFYLSGTEDILHETVIATVLTALDASLSGFEQQEVIRYLRTALSGMERSTCDLVENYAFLWGIRGSSWQTEWTRHPDGLGCADTPQSAERLQLLNSARSASISPLLRLRRGMQSAACLAEQIDALYDFLTQIHMPEQITAISAEMLQNGHARDSQILNQLWDILMNALEQLYDVMGQTVWEPEHFVRLLRLLLSQYSVGTIPPSLDAVQVGPVSAMRCHKADHLILLGANEGCLPRYSGSSGILTDQERRRLREMKVTLTGGGEEGIQEEFAEIYGVFCGACRSIQVCCSDSQPSYVFRRLQEMAGSVLQADTGTGFACSDQTEAAARLCARGDHEQACQLGLLDKYDQIRALADYSPGSILPDNVRKLYGNTLRMSASQVDTQAECRMSYFLKYGLRAKERKEAQIDPAEFGTYVHDVLEHTCAEIRDLGGFHQVSLDQTLDIAHKYSKEYAEAKFSQLNSDRAAYLFHRNLQELDMIVGELWDELSHSEFSPAGFEVDFGNKPGSLPAIQIPGTDIPALLRGFVDRVDVWQSDRGNWYRIVDYKTGRKAFDYCDVLHGIGLQMLLYLFALQDSGYEPLCDHPQPAGVQYFPARAAYISADTRPDEAKIATERRKAQVHSGLILNDPNILQAMEPGNEPFRCYKLTKSGPDGNLADRAQLELLRKHVFRALKKIVNDISSGSVEPNPYSRGSSHNACSFCPYGSVCHGENAPGRRSRKAVSKEDFWKSLEEEV